MNTLAEYRKRVAALAHARTGEPIANSSFEHAAVVIEQMFKSAERQVCILSGNLNARVYGREAIIDQAKAFLSEGSHSCSILVESDDVLLFKNHPFFERLRNNDNLRVGIIPRDLRPLYEYHFLVMDDDSYRFEPTKDEPVAVAAFGDTEVASNLLNIFPILYDASAEVDLLAASRLQIVS